MNLLSLIRLNPSEVLFFITFSKDLYECFMRRGSQSPYSFYKEHTDSMAFPYSALQGQMKFLGRLLGCMEMKAPGYVEKISSKIFKVQFRAIEKMRILCLDPKTEIDLYLTRYGELSVHDSSRGLFSCYAARKGQEPILFSWGAPIKINGPMESLERMVLLLKYLGLKEVDDKKFEDDVKEKERVLRRVSFRP